jgi:hypothetical protein
VRPDGAVIKPKRDLRRWGSGFEAEFFCLVAGGLFFPAPVCNGAAFLFFVRDKASKPGKRRII